MKKPLTEFVGTFILVLTIGLAVTTGSAMAPLAIGAALMVMVYAGGHISGGHYNPAVTIALLMRGAIPSKDLLPYVVSQLLGAIGGALATFAIVGKTFAPMPGADATTLGALLVEILYTFALVYVVFNVAVSKKTQGNSYYGLAIGFTVGAAAFAAGDISGGAFNPAVGIGPSLVHFAMGNGSLGALWLYLVGPLAGAALAATVYGFQES